MTVRTRCLLVGLALILGGVIVVSLHIGNYHIPVARVWALLCGGGDDTTGAAASYDRAVLLNLRLPRLLLASLTGAALACGGAASQAIFRNPLVSPFILGISAGASFGAAFAIVFLARVPGAVDVAASLGGLLAVLLAWLVARRADGFVPRLSLVLSGVVVGSFFTALVGIMQLLADTDTQLPAITFWMLGGFGRVGWESVWPNGAVVLLCLLALTACAWPLNVLAMGDREAATLGLATERWKAGILLLVVVAVGACVARVGVIGWIGLVVPHLARGLVGPNHRDLLPACALLGALMLVGADDLARTATSGEIPVGILTALLGAPFFVYIVRRQTSEVWG